MSPNLSYRIDPTANALSVGVNTYGEESDFTAPSRLVYANTLGLKKEVSRPSDTDAEFIEFESPVTSPEEAREELQIEAESDRDAGTVTVYITDRSGAVLPGSRHTFDPSRFGFRFRDPAPDLDSIRNDIERSIIDRGDGKTLWRVGVPRISDTWIDSFNSGRGSGGAGSGIYAYVTREGAERDSSSVGGDGPRDRYNPQPISALVSALERPLVVTGDSPERMFEMNDASRVLSAIGVRERAGDNIVDALRDEHEGGGELYRDWFPKDRSLDYHARKLSFIIGSQAPDRYGSYDTDTMLTQMLDAVERAAAQEATPKSRGGEGGLRQPMNFLLYPTFDGVYPTADAGGDSNQWGAVVFQEKIEMCVGRSLAENTEVPTDTLNDCFQ